MDYVRKTKASVKLPKKKKINKNLSLTLRRDNFLFMLLGFSGFLDFTPQKTDLLPPIQFYIDLLMKLD